MPNLAALDQVQWA